MRFSHCGVLLRRRLIWVLTLAAAFLAAPGLLRAEDETAASIHLLIRDASRALQANNAALFLSKFDLQSSAGFDDLSVEVRALAAQRRIASSVESGPLRTNSAGPTVTVDWMLRLTPLLDPGPVEDRREKLSLRFAKRNGKWKIVALEPIAFFRSR